MRVGGVVENLAVFLKRCSTMPRMRRIENVMLCRHVGALWHAPGYKTITARNLVCMLPRLDSTCSDDDVDKENG